MVLKMSATQIAAAVSAGEVTPEEVLDATLAEVERLDPHLNAFVHVGEEQARDSARRLLERLRRGEDCGPLVGVPTAMKDLFSTYPGWPATFGGAMDPGAFVGSSASTFPARVERAGAVVVGMTNSPALGFRGTCDNAVFGPTRNAFDLERNSGGSSGGSAAAVAAGILPVAHATDGGGSIRIPSAWSGVYGFQPSRGRVPLVMRPNAFGGVAPFLYEGAVSRTVADAALVLSALAGPDRRDPFSATDVVDWQAALGGSVAGLRVGYTRDFGVFAVEPAVAAAVEASLSALEEQGAVLVPLDLELPYGEHELSDLWCRMISAGNVSAVAGLESAGIEVRRNLPEPVLEWMEVAASATAADLERDQVLRTAVLDAVEGAFDTVDLIAAPTVGSLAVRNAAAGRTVGPDRVDGVAVNPLIGWCLTYLTNFTGHPAASLPGGLLDGLPFGVQLIGPRGGDALLVAASARFEEARPWNWLYDRLDPALTA
jgi:amidase/aspartyl-tRNA(Asn)/glutamyl-tRNA(Gln) amidotransferase subunit A